MSKETKTKHTDGPWLISTIEGEDNIMVGGYSDGSNIVADIRTHHKEHEANAHLIASAPEMYEALCQLHSMHRAFSDKLPSYWTTLDDEARRLAETAIAHAEGRELGT